MPLICTGISSPTDYILLTCSMSDPGTTYRTRDEVQQMRAQHDAIAGLKKYITEWGVADEAQLKAIDKAAKEEVDVAVEEAKKSPFPDLKEFWTDIYVSVDAAGVLMTLANFSSTRAPSPLSCEDERRRRFTSTRRLLLERRLVAE